MLCMASDKAFLVKQEADEALVFESMIDCADDAVVKRFAKEHLYRVSRYEGFAYKFAFSVTDDLIEYALMIKEIGRVSLELLVKYFRENISTGEEV